MIIRLKYIKQIKIFIVMIFQIIKLIKEFQNVFLLIMIDCISQMENSKNKFRELMDILKSSVKDIIIIV